MQATAAGKVELTEAQIIVSGGRGLKGPENFHLVEELAAALGAAVGASRAVVDAGWVDHQLPGRADGQDGVADALRRGRDQRRHPAPGRHVVVEGDRGHQQGRRTRPIFKVANYGLVGDVFEILPKLTAAAKDVRKPAQRRRRRCA